MGRSSFFVPLTEINKKRKTMSKGILSSGTWRSCLLLAVVLGVSASVQGKVRLPHLVSDNMVIQQQTDVRLWGWAKAGKKVVATTSWSDQRSEAKADK